MPQISVNKVLGIEMKYTWRRWYLGTGKPDVSRLNPSTPTLVTTVVDKNAKKDQFVYNWPCVCA